MGRRRGKTGSFGRMLSGKEKESDGMGLGNGSWDLQEVGKCGQLDGQFAREA